MSQTKSEQPLIPPAFRRTPINPYTEAVAKREQEIQAETTPQPNPLPEPVLASQPQPQPQPQPVQVVNPTPTPTPTPMHTPVQQPVGIDPQLAHQLQYEREQLLRENEALRQQLGDISAQFSEANREKQKQQLMASVDNMNFDGLETIDVDDARRVARATLDAVSAPLEQTRQSLAAERQRIEAMVSQQQEQQERDRLARLNREILAVHPDFFELQKTPEYQAYMQGRDGLSSKTRDQIAAEEFYNGNTAFVINMLNDLKGIRPKVDSIQSVAPVQVATSAGSNVGTTVTEPMTLRDLNNLYQMRRISHDEYRKRLGELRAAANS